MSYNGKGQKKGGYPPSNVSSNYYTEPVYATDAFFGFEGELNDTPESQLAKSGETGDKAAVDEPIESWGWINNIDSRRF